MKALLFLEDTRVNYLLAERDGENGRWPNTALWSVTVGAMRAMYDGEERASFWGVSEADLEALPTGMEDDLDARLAELDLPVVGTAIERLRERVLLLANGATVPGANPAAAATLGVALDGRRAA